MAPNGVPCEFRGFLRKLAKPSDHDETAKQRITSSNHAIWRLSHGDSRPSMKNGESPAVSRTSLTILPPDTDTVQSPLLGPQGSRDLTPKALTRRISMSPPITLIPSHQCTTLVRESHLGGFHVGTFRREIRRNASWSSAGHPTHVDHLQSGFQPQFGFPGRPPPPPPGYGRAGARPSLAPPNRLTRPVRPG